MAAFIDLMKLLIGCGTVLFIVLLVLLALPQSKLRYVGLEIVKWVMAAGLFLMVPSPVDVVPDVLPPFTYLDDLGYIIAAIGMIKSARGDRRKRGLLEEIELAELQVRVETARAGAARSEPARVSDAPAPDDAEKVEA